MEACLGTSGSTGQRHLPLPQASPLSPLPAYPPNPPNKSGQEFPGQLSQGSDRACQLSWAQHSPHFCPVYTALPQDGPMKPHNAPVCPVPELSPAIQGLPQTQTHPVAFP